MEDKVRTKARKALLFHKGHPERWKPDVVGTGLGDGGRELIQPTIYDQG
jgi:hypothetical protein